MTETATSVLAIEIDDSQFKTYQADFYKYSAAVKNLPQAWGAVNKGTQAGTSEFVKMVALLGKIEEHTRNVGRNVEQNRKSVIASNLSWKGLADASATVAKNAASITGNMIKWVGLGGILGAAGGLFGLSSLAGAASDMRRTSQGLGVSPGELRALQVNYSKYLDVNSTLGNIANTKSDLSKRWAFNALGVQGVDQKDPAELLPELIPKMVAAFKRTGQTQQGADALGLTNFVDIDTLRRLSKLSPDELQRTAASYGRDKTSLGLSDDTLQKWQNLSTQLDRAKDKIETVLIDKLTALAGPLGNLSDSIVNAISEMLSNPDLGKWITGLGEDIEKFASYVGTQEFRDNMSDFVHGIGQLAEKIVDALKLLGVIDPRSPEQKKADEDAENNPKDAFGNAPPTGGFDQEGNPIGEEARPAWQKKVFGSGASNAQLPSKERAANRDAVVAQLMGYGWTAAQASGIAGNMAQESGFDPNAKNAAGMRGLIQWNKARQKKFEEHFGFGLDDPRATLAKQTEFVNYELHQQEYKQAFDALQANKNNARGSSDAFMKYDERPGDSSGPARADTAAAINAQIKVTVADNTGGSVNTNVAQMTPQT